MTKENKNYHGLPQNENNNEEPLTCEACGGSLKKEKINLEEFEGGKLYHMENIPAYICLNCGETWIPEESIHEFEKMIEIVKLRRKKHPFNAAKPKPKKRKKSAL
ncbi:MAG: YgiT-type zinc finger protein [Candidatus Margulisbacteria bacterium]|nr:YgiT-type zinc finger protein [Candidatus Margulisiibacteriota bacterium]MBU1022597.1 YgiT-type zinc finger protein [Candidatus Margulisiibacteriota bacterium]MBU1728883.1 YgiT-type zinc finger protein [Candidatus Margulisiibacteriota bacterium]MBU1955514.1 YgiT-type zinc finger protein [Candidatus Margulisiibacteriota bacterium]